MPRPPPLPLGQQTIGYRTPGAEARSDDPQKIFDTVAGRNTRLRDNLFQLASLPVGAVIGATIATSTASPADITGYAIFGGIGGAALALVVSGLVIGVVGFVRKGRR